MEKREVEALADAKNVEVEAQTKRKKMDAKKLLQDTTIAELAVALGAAYDTLQHDLEELGVESVEDLKELEAEHIEQLAAKLKVVQAKKFTKKIAALHA